MNRTKRNIKKLNGSKWIRPDLRVSIIAIRDAVEKRFCPYCLQTVEDGIRLCLDHITPRIYGGSNKVCNLITCCVSCNSKRQDKTIPEFLREIMGYSDDVVIEIVRFINRQRIKEINRDKGKKLLELRPLSYWSNH